MSKADPNVPMTATLGGPCGTYGNPNAVGGVCPPSEPDPLVERLRCHLEKAMRSLDAAADHEVAVSVAAVIEHLANAIRALEGR